MQDQRARLARGRRLIRIANWVLGVNGVLTTMGVGATLLAVRQGWVDDNDATPAVIGIIPIAAGMIAFFVLAFTGRHMIGRSIEDVAANPNQEAPETFQVGRASPWPYITGAAAFLILTMVTLALFSSRSNWLCAGLVVALFLVQFGWSGPSALGVHSARLDATGIRLPELGIHLPWTSVRQVKAKRSGVWIDIDGPVESSGRLPAVWTRRAIHRLHRYGGVDLSTGRQDEVVWTAQRYINLRD